MRNLRVENNIVYENAQLLGPGHVQGIDFVASTGTGSVIRNNFSFASGRGGTAFLDATSVEGVDYSHSGNVENAGDPLFVAAPAEMPDFHLMRTSPVIDRGTAVAEVLVSQVRRDLKELPTTSERSSSQTRMGRQLGRQYGRVGWPRNPGRRGNRGADG